MPPPPPVTDLAVPELASDAYTSPRMALRWRGRGADDERAAGFFVDVRQVGLRSGADWRTLVAGALVRTTIFTGAPGAAYVVRARERAEGWAGYGDPSSATVVVPLDERDRRLKLSRGWRRQRRAGAWRRTTAASASTRATAKLRFSERRVRVIVRRTPTSGPLAVAVDGRPTIVRTAGPTAERQVAFDSGPLRRGTHRLTLRPAGGRVEIDAIAPG